MSGGWRPFDHTGDVGYDLEGATEEEVFAAAAGALFEVLAGASPIEPLETRAIAVDAPDREMLLVRWLRELLHLHESEGWVFGSFDVSLEERAGGPGRLSAVARGERYDPERHRLRTEIKAVTYHQIALAPGPDGRWRGRIVFDI